MATVTAPHSCDPSADAQALSKVLEGWGNNKNFKGIIEIIGHRTSAQLGLIKEAYYQQHGEDLVKRFEKELNGDFEGAAILHMRERFDRDSILLNDALKKGDHLAVVELVCIRTPEELLGLRGAYEVLYDSRLEEDVASQTTGEARMILVLLVSPFKYDIKKATVELAESLAKESSIARKEAAILASGFKCQFDHGSSSTEPLEERQYSEYEDILDKTLKCIEFPHEYLEGVLREGLLKRGTDEDSVTRVIVTRAEKDLAEIKEIYYKRNGVTLESAVDQEMQGDTKRFLLALLGAEGH